MQFCCSQSTYGVRVWSRFDQTKGLAENLAIMSQSGHIDTKRMKANQVLVPVFAGHTLAMG